MKKIEYTVEEEIITIAYPLQNQSTRTVILAHALVIQNKFRPCMEVQKYDIKAQLHPTEAQPLIIQAQLLQTETQL